MSFILKALQKVEEEKTARRSIPQDINRAILTAGSPSPRTGRILPVAAVTGLVALAGGALAYLLWPTDNEPLRQPAPTALTRESRAPESRQPSADSAQTAQASGSITTPALSVTAVGPSGKPLHGEEGLHGEAPPSSGKPAPAARPRTERTDREGTYGPPPGLKVNGIALQDNPAESVAVVNGQLVRRGMVIQGMKVEEILTDRVKFAGSGGSYEVTISK